MGVAIAATKEQIIEEIELGYKDGLAAIEKYKNLWQLIIIQIAGNLEEVLLTRFGRSQEWILKSLAFDRLGRDLGLVLILLLFILS